MTNPERSLTLRGRTALVTGGAGGIGAAAARELAGLGARVVVADRDGAAAGRLADELDGASWQVDLAELDAPAFADEALRERLGDVDILVNNAGLQHVAPIAEFGREEYRRILAVMLEAPFLLVRAALPGMYERGFGRVINVSSVHGLRASPFKSAYVAAKHGLEGFSKVVALEGGPHGVTSSCVNPGYVRTALVEQQIAQQSALHGIPPQQVLERVLLAESAVKRLVEPAEVASLIGWLASPAAAMVTGSSYTMDGGWTAH
ncbi:3-hydroxybutyrate dehydrogenase [Herbiconiux sp. KACC 21604]|uniref:3-hydroxybutyrate dehydrogenase n=1 Tax=unclassified Herbiconiux TaxID=2618217 RepID=UPI001491DE71|nr:3-hydroxybutyrate dehydrogenase [Herbiconiux sp. SALV-R1]QJU53865.1 3-hydroxybutyrate dehydrogenase [Herbiconiux sp. SALV-R1]WPO84878.1 3-hydroxybutyrate dehydrogenase [Herbiconiux sp. KACC 21604]